VPVWRGRPVPASFASQYLVCLAPLLVLGASFLTVRELGIEVPYSEDLWSLPRPRASALTLAWAALIILGVLLWVVRVSLKPLAYYLALLTTGEVGVRLYPACPRTGVYALSSLLALLCVEVYRRSLRYELTGTAVIIRWGLLSRSERTILLDRVTDVVVVRPALGRLLGYGHVLPLTPSQLGTGERASAIAVGAGAPRTPLGAIVGGLRSVRELRVDPHNSLYGVKRPEELRDMLLSIIAGRRSS